MEHGRGPAYAELMSMAMDGQISSILASPNCRTRSKLRHVEIPGSQEVGKKENGESQDKVKLS